MSTSLPNVILGTVLCLTVGSFLPTTYAQSDFTNEYHIKAAFLYNLAKMTEWPGEDPQTTAPLTICFYGQDSFGDAVNSIKDKKVKKRPLSLIKNVVLNQIEKCHILFIDKTELKRLAYILSQVKNRPIMTVGDIDTFADLGGMVNLLKAADKVDIEINSCASKNAGLTISSRLLALARIVDQDKGC
jgi:YfiR/HmsC-like